MNTNISLNRPQSLLLFSSQNQTSPFKNRQFHQYRRRRIKKTLITPHNHLLSFENVITTTTTLGLLASGLTTLYLSRRRPNPPHKASDIGEWLLFTSPTPFNRFVILRCPTISFDSFDDLDERLVQEDRHFVKLDSGRVLLDGEEAGDGEKLEYQRVCVSTEDGGVVSIDWPADLDLEEERGLDTTVILVPGTPKGSLDEDVRTFAREALRRGVFPVVMNPRGCAGSPLTTARLFTAADSDDISTAIQFISKARPWTMLMGVGWGYGANMLTKYLGEVGERTPLTAALCINNPFDLEEATRCSPYHVELDKKLTGGLRDILRSNKELFQGRLKRFDVDRAVSSRSVRDFDKAISMVSYGFEEIEKFYSKSSSRAVVGNVKIPVLFIQNDDGTVPMFSIPRSLIAQNPFTSLLLCSCEPSGTICNGKAATSWCQKFAIEWLSAVELGLLKGRHSTLKDVDVTINPAKGLALVEGRVSDSIKINRLLDVTPTNSHKHPLDHVKEVLEDDGNATMRFPSKQSHGSQSNLDLKDGLPVVNDSFQHCGPGDSDWVNNAEDDEEYDLADTERGQVLQTTKVVMNMLDVTMPGILTQEEKKKVLLAVGQGETVVKALQDAVPEDVRGKLTTAASAILHLQQTNLKVDKLLGIDKISHLSSGLRSKISEKVGGVSRGEGMPRQSSDQMKIADDLADGFDASQHWTGTNADGTESETAPSYNRQKLSDIDHVQSIKTQASDTSGGDTDELRVHQNSKEAAIDKSTDRDMASLGTSTNFSCIETTKDGGLPHLEANRESDIRKEEDQSVGSLSGPDKGVPSNTVEELVSSTGSSHHTHPVENEGNDGQNKENKTIELILAQNRPATPDSGTPSFDVAQALDALTVMDDSTQVAVNNVFGVIEDIISKMEDEDADNDAQERVDGNELASSALNTLQSTRDSTTGVEGNDKNGKTDSDACPDTLGDSFAYQCNESSAAGKNAASTGWMEGEQSKDCMLFSGQEMNCSKQEAATYDVINIQKMQQNYTGSKFLADYISGHEQKTPLYNITNPYRDHLKNEYFGRYLFSKIPKHRPLDLDATTALLLDYLPEEGQWKLFEESENKSESIAVVNSYDSVSRNYQECSHAGINGLGSFIEPSYVVLDSDESQESQSLDEFKSLVKLKGIVEDCDDKLVETMQHVKSIILEALKVEVARKRSIGDSKPMDFHLAGDLEQVANAVSFSIANDNDVLCLQGEEYNTPSNSGKLGTLNGENLATIISSAVMQTSYLRRVLPVGVIIGTSLAALRKHFSVATEQDGVVALIRETEFSPGCCNEKIRKGIGLEPTRDKGRSIAYRSSPSTQEEEATLEDKTNKTNEHVVVGAVTAALGASALLMQQENDGQKTMENLHASLRERGNHQQVSDKLGEAVPDKSQSNIVTSLAEKAMSVAAPVVPTKEDGEVDQERLVAMLVEWGQKGGALKLIGKVALLWGGIRGAMSLTDRLISFLRIAERPLYQRVIGFIGMVLVLWSPVVVPLLPTLVQSWTASNTAPFGDLVCIVGLYVAITILIMLWGRRIRGYQYPLEQYGLDLTALPKMQGLFKGFMGGLLLVLLIQSVNALVGCVSFSWPSNLTSISLDAITFLKLYGRMMMMVARGSIAATGIVLVEELLFRSWLPEEIGADLGYYQGIIISGLVFSLFQRSIWAMPGLCFLSLALSGLRQQGQGSLSTPIGLRAGILATSFVLQSGGIVMYNRNLPIWLTGTHPLQPFSGVVGLAFSLLLAILFHPKQPLLKKEKM